MLARKSFRFAACSAIAASMCHPLAVHSATYVVSDANWGTSSQVNSFAWALAQAEANIGHDTIEVSPGLSINVNGASSGAGLWLTTISQNLTINGNGSTLVGNPEFVTSGGTIYDKFNVDRFNPTTDILAQQAFSFARVDAAANLAINGLSIDGLNGYLHMGKGSTATVSNATARNTVNYGGFGRSVFEALDGAALSITNVVLDRINPFLTTIEFAWEGAIAGTNATLNMMQSQISRAGSAAGAVVWSGGVANIVSSFIEDSGGLSIRDDTTAGVMNLVNSLVSVSAQNSDIQRLQALAGGELNIIASTILQDALYTSSSGCLANPYNCNGKPLTALAGGVISLQQSVVSVINTDFAPGDTSYWEGGLASTGQLVALDSVWVQPTAAQPASELQLLFDNPALLTSGTPFNLTDFGGGVTSYATLPGGAMPNPDGPLVNAISDADGVNQLINPIDGSVITTDLLGQPRSSEGFRDIGAIQQTQSVPGPLPLLGLAAVLGWSRVLRRRIRQAAAGSTTS